MRNTTRILSALASLALFGFIGQPSGASSGVTVTLTPAVVALQPAGSQQFTATVAGTSQTVLVWSVAEGDAGGSVSPDGLYTAPSVPGTYHVMGTHPPSGVSAAAVITVAARAHTKRAAITVRVVPGAITLEPGDTQAFRAVVTGTTNATVRWSIQESGGGTISTAGLYRAPATAGTYHVVATSAADASVKGTATVSVQRVVSIQIAPTAVTLPPRGTQTFRATVAGAANTTVTWRVQEGGPGGAIASTGTYTAPAAAGTYHVVATSVADRTATASATVTVHSGIGVSVRPVAVQLGNGDTQAFRGIVAGTTNKAVTWRVQEGDPGGAITAGGIYTAPVSGGGVFHVVATSTADPTRSASATVTVPTLIRVQVAPATATLPVGGRQTFRATVTDSPNTIVTWSIQEGATGGAITAAGVYTAPAVVGTYHVVATSFADKTKSGSAAVTVLADDIALPAGARMALAYVPAGAFLMGDSGQGDDATDALSKERPQHRVTLSAYWIGKYQVTRGQYRLFMNAGGYATRSYWSADGWAWKTGGNHTQPLYWDAQQNWGNPPGVFTQTDNHPVVAVTYYEAEAFCKWAGLRLPTEAEWEKAARWDGHPRIYPWGDTWDPEKLNSIYDTRYRGAQTAPVGSYPAGASPYGCLDMAGNAWEWCKDWFGPYSGSAQTNPQGPSSGTGRVLRGGSWASNGRTFYRAAFRNNDRPNPVWWSNGFRCAKSSP